MLISPLISAPPDGRVSGVLPDAWQSGWRGFVLGMGLLALAWLMFEVGFWAGTQEERAYWAPQEAPPRHWPRVFRGLLRWEHLVRGKSWPRRRAKAPETMGRHRTPPPSSP